MRLVIILILLMMTLTSIVNCRWFDPTIKYTDEEQRDPNAMLEKGREYFIDDYEYVAIQVFTDLINKKFQNISSEQSTNAKGWAYYERGFIYFKLGEYDKARKDFNFLIDNFAIKEAKRLALKLIYKMDKGEAKKRSTYSED